MKCIKIHPSDSVAVAVKPLKVGETITVNNEQTSLLNDIPAGHKFALKDIKIGENMPTAKISSNSTLANKKKMWIDFNAGQLLENKSMPELTNEFLEFVLNLASGEIKAKAEKLDKHEPAIFKDGVTL